MVPILRTSSQVLFVLSTAGLFLYAGHASAYPSPLGAPSMPKMAFTPDLEPVDAMTSLSAYKNARILGVQASEDKLVVAHFVVGNTHDYAVDDWKRDIALAASKGLDGFALNFGKDDWQPAKLDDAYAAAQAVSQSGSANFGLFLSPDLSSLPCATMDDAAALRKVVEHFGAHSNQLRINGSAILSSFGGEGCAFGVAGWKAVSDGTRFVPGFFGDVHAWVGWDGIGGGFNWNAAWPANNTDINWDSDDTWMQALDAAGGSKTYMAPVSPWFFTHFGKDTFNKNFLYRGDDWLLSTRWEMLMSHRDKLDIVQVVSWNDFGESHYVGPVEGALPQGSEAWVEGYQHLGWLEMMQYYIQAFKTGSYPDIKKDQAFLWARLFPRDAGAPTDDTGKPDHWDWTDDYLWSEVHLIEAATVTLFCSPSDPTIVMNSTNTQDLPKGMSRMKLALVDPQHNMKANSSGQAGDGKCALGAEVWRGGSRVLSVQPGDMRFGVGNSRGGGGGNGTVDRYNFNAFVANSG